MGARKKVAVLSDFPVWLYTDGVPPHAGHYAVWLAALHEALANQDEFEIHWVVLNRDAAEPLRFTSRGQCMHVLPRMRRLAGLCDHAVHLVCLVNGNGLCSFIGHVFKA